MKQIKRLLIAATLLLAASASALTFSTNNVPIPGAAGTAHQLLAGTGYRLLSITVTPSNNVAPVLFFFDGNNGLRGWSNAAYVTVSKYTTNIVESYTNFFGSTNTWTNTLIYTTYTTNAAASNAWQTVYTLQTTTNSTAYTVDFPGGLPLVYGLALSNSQGAHLFFQYTR